MTTTLERDLLLIDAVSHDDALETADDESKVNDDLAFFGIDSKKATARIAMRVSHEIAKLRLARLDDARSVK